MDQNKPPTLTQLRILCLLSEHPDGMIKPSILRCVPKHRSENVSHSLSRMEKSGEWLKIEGKKYVITADGMRKLEETLGIPPDSSPLPVWANTIKQTMNTNALKAEVAKHLHPLPELESADRDAIAGSVSDALFRHALHCSLSTRDDLLKPAYWKATIANALVRIPEIQNAREFKSEVQAYARTVSDNIYNSPIKHLLPSIRAHDGIT